MADTTHNALTAAIRAMDEVVVPAVDRDHPLAHEQARLVSGSLKLLAARQDFVHDRDRFELRLHVRQAQTLQTAASRLSPAIAAQLQTAAAEGEAALADPGASTARLREFARRLAALTTALVRTAAEAQDDLRREIEAVVLACAKPWLDVQRAWFAPQGWDPDSAQLPSLQAALHVSILSGDGRAPC